MAMRLKTQPMVKGQAVLFRRQFYIYIQGSHLAILVFKFSNLTILQSNTLHI